MINKIVEFFKPVPDSPVMVSSPEDVKTKYGYWRTRVMYSTFIGYAIFYFVRKNISVAMPVMEKALGFSKADLGLFLTLHGVLYGISKFVNGMIGDRANPRYFMAAGLIISAIMNIFFGLSSGVITLGIFWMINGWFQGMGFPPCARLLSHWFGAKERGRKWAIWNSSHQVGLASIVILAGYLAPIHWRLSFFVPAAIALLVSIFVIDRLRDTPGSLGLPPVEQYLEEELSDRPTHMGQISGLLVVESKEPSNEKQTPGKEESFGKFLVENVFKNKFIWIISVANFFLYILRYGVMDWAPTFLTELKGIPLQYTGWMASCFEVAGLIGSLVAGWITDTYLKGRRGPVCVLYLLFSVFFVFLLWKTPSCLMIDNYTLASLEKEKISSEKLKIIGNMAGHKYTREELLTELKTLDMKKDEIDILLKNIRIPVGNLFTEGITLSILGFLVYGPQFLVGVMVTDQATKHAAASAIGLTGFFGYLSSVVSGWGLGWVVDNYGWNGGFILLMICSVISTLLFALTWNVKPKEEGVFADEGKRT